MWYVWFKHTWLNILWLYNVLSHDSSLVKKQIHSVFNKSLNLAMVCGPILYRILSLKNKTVLVKVLFFFVLFWIFFMHRLSFWGLFRVILIRDLKLYGGGFLFCVFIGFGGIFFPYEVIQHLPDYLLINKHMKKSTDLHAHGTLKSNQQHKHPVCSWAHLTEQVVLLPGGHVGK